MRAFFSINEDSPHRLEEVSIDLFEVSCLIEGGGAGEEILFKDLEKQLHIAR